MIATEEKATQILREMVKKFLDTAEWGDWLHKATDGNTRRNEHPTRTPLI